MGSMIGSPFNYIYFLTNYFLTSPNLTILSPCLKDVQPQQIYALYSVCSSHVMYKSHDSM